MEADASLGKTALVLSAGGMFGAYQAGVWKSLSSVLRPDLVVGVSAGALNGWAIAGGATAEELVSHWQDPETAGLCRFKRTLKPWRGVFDSHPIRERVRTIWAAHRPLVPIGITAVELPALQQRLFTTAEIGWEHLAASCAIPFGYEWVRIGDKFYTDGGLLDVLPLWAAVRMGATRIIGVNALPLMPSATIRAFVRCVRAVARARRPEAAPVEAFVISPSQNLGRLRSALFWQADTVERWIALGAEDGARFAASTEWARPIRGDTLPTPILGQDSGF